MSLANRNMKEVYRDPLSVGLGAGMPALLLVLFASLGRKAPIEIFTPGSLVPAVAVFSFGFLTMFSSMLLSKDRQSAFLTRLLVTPLKSTDFILAYSLPYVPVALLQIAVSLGVGIIMGLTPGTGILLAMLVIIPVAIICIAFGLILGSLCTENQVAGIGSSLIVVISLFGGAWMDLKMVGGLFESIGYALPFAHGIDAARALLKGAGFNDILTSLYWVFGYMIALSMLGILAFNWKTKR
jgi:ABC-2 type transport system permease protein